MQLIAQVTFANMERSWVSEAEFSSFTLYFLAFDHSDGSDDASAKKLQRFKREGAHVPYFLSIVIKIDRFATIVGVLELTHNHGTESDASFAGYASGNDEPGKGYGHIAITVADVQAACARFEQLGVTFQKRLTDGKMRHIAFIKDPDG